MKNHNDPEYWEERFQKENTPWELGEASPTLVELEKVAEFRPGSSVIVPGCGRGQDALHFCRLNYQVSAVDWAKPAIEELRVLARRERLSLEALKADFWAIPASWFHTFDIWVEHTFFCAIDPIDRARYVDQLLNLLKPGGDFIGAMFIRNQFEDRSIRGDGGPPFWSTEKEITELFSPHFEILKLEPSLQAHPDRSTLEWRAHFKRHHR